MFRPSKLALVIAGESLIVDLFEPARSAEPPRSAGTRLAIAEIAVADIARVAPLASFKASRTVLSRSFGTARFQCESQSALRSGCADLQRSSPLFQARF